MAEVRIDIVGRSYLLACRDGEEAHLLKLGRLVDAKARDAARAMGSMTENRQLLVTALLLADQLNEGTPIVLDSAPSETELAALDAAGSAAALIDDIAARLEKLAIRVENEAPNA